MKNLTIKARLIAILAFMSVLLVAIGGMGLVGMSKANEGLRTVYEDRTVALEQLTQIDRLILRNRIAIAIALVTPSPEFMRRNADEVDKNIETIGGIWKQYMATYLTPEERKIAEKFALDRGRFVNEGLKPAIAALRDNKPEDAKRIVTDHVRPLYEPVKEGVDALIKLQIDVAAQEYQESQARYATLRNVSFAVVGAGALLAAFIGYLLVRAITVPLNAAVTVAGKIADGDLDNDIQVTTRDETGKLLAALKAMNAKLYGIVSEVRASSASVGSAAKQISAGNADLSSRTQEQASALEETASSMEEMTSTVKQNADNARQANQLANGARDQAEKGGQVVSKAVSAMGEINSSSRKIADIISVIDEIAFQTNLLALNAAVEAARAGEQGRGFAVVASEVRNLAQRSAGAAKEIKTLINDSVDKVKAGSELVDESGRTLTQIVESVKKVTDIVAEIAAASQEQAAGIDQVNKAVMQMDEVTQQNAALVEEAAAASRSMEEQAANLNTQMAFFKIGDAAAITVKPAAGMAPKAGKGNGAAHPGNGASHPAHGHLAEAVHTRLAAVRRNPTPTAANGSDGDGQWKEF